MIDGHEMLSLIPHRGKMLLISRVLTYNIEKCSLNAEYDIDSACQFYEITLGGIPSWVSFECMAQAISALCGIGRRLRGDEPTMGVILSVSNLTLYEPVLRGTAFITVTEDIKLDAAYSFNGAVRCGVTNKLCAEAKLTVMDIETDAFFKMMRADAEKFERPYG
jgi:predicted hotdog family 3-hydroxylacyl-ACP dehydratase